MTHFSLIPLLLVFAMLQVVAEPIESKTYSQEITKENKRPPSDKLSAKRLRDWMEALEFPAFQFKGSVRDAITFFMQESKKHNKDGLPAGGFSIKHGVKLDAQIDLKLKKVNGLDILNELCSEAKAVWQVGTYSIQIEKQAEQDVAPDG